MLIGVAITVANVAVPVVIGRELSERSGAVLGAYTVALNVGSMITLSLTVPIADASGWRFALAAWGALVVAAVVWWWATRSLRDDDADDTWLLLFPWAGKDASPARFEAVQGWDRVFNCRAAASIASRRDPSAGLAAAYVRVRRNILDRDG